jgi:hypothetical protein
LVNELLLLNLLLICLLVRQVLGPALSAEVNVGHVLFNSLNVKVDDLTTDLLVGAEVALTGVGAQINESSLLSSLWSRLFISNLLLRVHIRTNLVADCSLLDWKHTWVVLFEVNCLGSSNEKKKSERFHY